jgi:hypothetical protein
MNALPAYVGSIRRGIDGLSLGVASNSVKFIYVITVIKNVYS